jgi:hypothetical protein
VGFIVLVGLMMAAKPNTALCVKEWPFEPLNGTLKAARLTQKSARRSSAAAELASNVKGLLHCENGSCKVCKHLYRKPTL